MVEMNDNTATYDVASALKSAAERRNNKELQDRVAEMMACPEAEMIGDDEKVRLKYAGDAYEKYHLLTNALARLPCAERISSRRDSYGFLYWKAKLPSGLEVRGSGADDRTTFGRDR